MCYGMSPCYLLLRRVKEVKFREAPARESGDQRQISTFMLLRVDPQSGIDQILVFRTL